MVVAKSHFLEDLFDEIEFEGKPVKVDFFRTHIEFPNGEQKKLTSQAAKGIVCYCINQDTNEKVPVARMTPYKGYELI